MGEPVRILHVLGRLDRGGAESMIMNVYRTIDRTRLQFDFIKHTEEECAYDAEIHKLGGRIFTMPRYNGKNHFTYKKSWYDFFKAHQEYGIIHGHVRSTATIYLNIAKKFGLITISHSHSVASRGNCFERVIKGIMQLPIRYNADYLFACSNEAGVWLFGENATKKPNYQIIKNAIQINRYIFNPAIRDKIRKSLNIENRFVIGHVGSFTYPKNHNFILEIFNNVLKINNNAILVLIGDGELRQHIEKQVDHLGIKDKVVLTGNIENVSDYLQAMDVFLFPSIFEGFGMAVIEAQAAGLPCIISDNITSEVKITGLVTDMSLNELSEQWAEAVLTHEYCNRDKESFQNIVEAGYDIEFTSNILQHFYKTLSEKNS